MAMLPIVERLAEASTDQERAEWLLTVPQVYLYRDQEDIARILRTANFKQGEELLMHEIACLLTARDGGELPLAACQARYVARLRVARIARKAVQA